MEKLIKKYIYPLIMLFCVSNLIACSKNDESLTYSEPKPSSFEQTNVEPSNNMKVSDNTPTDIAVTSTTPKDIEIDYSNEFEGLQGCAVIFDSQDNTYYFYNKDMSNEEVSPYSTFKIVSTLIGLNNNVIKNKTSTMNYNGTHYPINEWNQNLTLKEAFQTSCIWYFRQVIDTIGQEKIKAELESLRYGNCDISEWEGNDTNSLDDLNGFWLNSSLKISPLEQVQVISNIFGSQSDYSSEMISTLKNIMLVDSNDERSIYGKTGTGIDGQGWFVGFSESKRGQQYFAVYLNDIQNKSSISGNKAKEIALKLIPLYDTK